MGRKKPRKTEMWNWTEGCREKEKVGKLERETGSGNERRMDPDRMMGRGGDKKRD